MSAHLDQARAAAVLDAVLDGVEAEEGVGEVARALGGLQGGAC